VNNAGVLGVNAPDDWLTVAHYEQCMAVNTFGVIRVTQAFKHLVKRRQGRVVTVASIAGRLAFPASGPYSVSKYAVEAYCDTIRSELSPFGVHVSILEPGFFKTNLLNQGNITTDIQKVWTALKPEMKEQYGEEFLKLSNKARADAVKDWASADINQVIDAYYCGLMSRFPRSRYHVGLDSKLFFIPMSMLPTEVQNCVMKMLMKARNAPMPAGATVNVL